MRLATGGVAGSVAATRDRAKHRAREGPKVNARARRSLIAAILPFQERVIKRLQAVTRSALVSIRCATVAGVCHPRFGAVRKRTRQHAAFEKEIHQCRYPPLRRSQSLPVSAVPLPRWHRSCVWRCKSAAHLALRSKGDLVSHQRVWPNWPAAWPTPTNKALRVPAVPNHHRPYGCNHAR
jgi:hypothetical protein